MRTSIALGSIALAKIAYHLALTGRYGIFRDELYYLACARHLSWGYVDHPPLSIALLAGIVASLGDSLFAIRLLPVLAGAAVLLLAGLLARELGGGRFAQVTTAVAVLIAPNFLAMSTFFSMNAFEQLFWLLAIHLWVRLMKGGDPRLWLIFGAVIGVALLNKLGTGVFAMAVVCGLATTRERRHFASPWLYAGGGVALLIFLPHLVWQIDNGWPFLEFMREAKASAPAIPPLQFLANQVLTHHPLNAPLCLAGVVYLFVAPSMRPFRGLGVVFVFVFGFFMLQEAKDYYVTPVYPIALAAGALALERAFERVLVGRAWRRVAQVGVLASLMGTGAAFAPAVMPVLSPEAYVRYVGFLGISPPAYVARRSTPMPQHLADRFGWEEMTQTIAEVYHSLPEEARATVRILCGNWGQAGAIDYFGPRHGVPNAISPHHSYWVWGYGDGPVESFIIIGLGSADDLRRYFDHVEARGRVRAPYAVENDREIYLARGLRRPIEEVWHEIRRF